MPARHALFSNVKIIQKMKTKLLSFGGRNPKLRVETSPPKALTKTLPLLYEFIVGHLGPVGKFESKNLLNWGKTNPFYASVRVCFPLNLKSTSQELCR